MPTFDFACQACGKVFEETILMGSKQFPPCPVCKSKNIQKLISPPNVHFKGEGFYKTDSRAKPKPAAANAIKNDPMPAAAEPATPPTAAQTEKA